MQARMLLILHLHAPISLCICMLQSHSSLSHPTLPHPHPTLYPSLPHPVVSRTRLQYIWRETVPTHFATVDGMFPGFGRQGSICGRPRARLLPSPPACHQASCAHATKPAARMPPSQLRACYVQSDCGAPPLRRCAEGLDTALVKHNSEQRDEEARRSHTFHRTCGHVRMVLSHRSNESLPNTEQQRWRADAVSSPRLHPLLLTRPAGFVGRSTLYTPHAPGVASRESTMTRHCADTCHIGDAS